VPLERKVERCQAMLFAGSTSYMWNQAPELKAAFLAVCSLEEGMDVLLMGKFLEESGLVAAMESILRSWGNLRVVELAPQAVAAWQTAGAGVKRPPLKWDFRYLDDVADGSLDRVVLFDAASHVSNWEYLGAEIERVLCRGGRAVVAEAPIGGAAFRQALAIHPGWQALVQELLAELSLDESSLESPEPDELRALLASRLTWARVHEWQGMYVCYGQKGLTEREELEAAMAAEMASQGAESNLAYVPGPDPFTAFPPANIWVRSFLKVRPVRTTWSCMSELEKEIWGNAAVELVLHERRRTRGLAQELTTSWACEPPAGPDSAGPNSAECGLAGRVLVIIGDCAGTSCQLARRLVEAFLGPTSVVKDGGLLEADESDISCELPAVVAKYPREHFDLVFVDSSLGNGEHWREKLSLLLGTLKSGGKLVLFGEDREAVRLASSRSAFARLLAARIVAPADPTAAESAALVCRRTDNTVLDPSSLSQAVTGLLQEVSVARRAGFVFVSGRKPRY